MAASSASLRSAILRALARPRVVPDLLEHFSFANFVKRLDAILHRFAPPRGEQSWSR